MPDNEEKLVKMLKYVSEHNDFYKNRIKEYGITNPLDITQWPILTRKELQENRYNMFSDGYKSKYFNQQLRRQSSSGSTGMPVNVYWDYKDWYASNMCLWRKRREWYGIKPGDRYCVFTLNAFGIIPEEGKIYYINDPTNILSFNVSLVRDEHGYEQMADMINDFCPDWLYIQPFVLNQLIRAYIKLGLEPVKTIRYIESVGEILTSDLRRRAEELFGVRVTDMYGSEEMNGIAMETPDGEMQIFHDNVLLEVKNEGGISTCGEGEAIITNLNNFAMPLIRYEQGDLIDVYTLYKPDEFLCTITLLTIRQIKGRLIETIIVNKEFEINPLMILEIMAGVINEYIGILLWYKFDFFKSNNELRCTIKIDKNKQHWSLNIKQTIEKEFRRIIPHDLLLNVVFSDNDNANENKNTILKLTE